MAEADKSNSPSSDSDPPLNPNPSSKPEDPGAEEEQPTSSSKADSSVARPSADGVSSSASPDPKPAGSGPQPGEAAPSEKKPAVPLPILSTKAQGIKGPSVVEQASATTKNEVFIAVMGQTGTGKSTFINQVAGTSLKAGHGLGSCTDTIQFAVTMIDGYKVTLIDTPGFDDTGKDDGEILALISLWLKRARSESKLLNGVVYLHRIMDIRMTGASVRSFTLMKKMCGTKTYHNIALATTMWDLVASPEIGKAREEQLRTEWWENIILGGGTIYRHDKAEDSARKIVTDLIPNKSTSLGIQDEMLTHDVLAWTTAGKYMTEQLQDLKKAHEKEIGRLREQINELVAEQAQNEVTKNELKDHLNESKKINEKLEDDMQRLHTKLAELEKAPIPGAPQTGFLDKLWVMLGRWEAKK